MSTEVDRRDGSSRIPFEALVEVGGASGPAFEAQAVNISEHGMQLRTAYLPEPGQFLSCRFELSGGEVVLAAGEVVWASHEGKGGEFGVRFSNLDKDGIAALRMLVAQETGADGEAAPEHADQRGEKVRLHIDGLASPMRARIRDSQRSMLTVGSDLGFLKVGKELSLEDVNGEKRCARIDGVAIDVEAESNVPQLIVRLRYSDVAAAPEIPASEDVVVDAESDGSHERENEVRTAHAHATEDADIEAVKRASTKVQGAFRSTLMGVGPKMAGFAKRAKSTLDLLSKRSPSAARGDDDAIPLRRTTAPPPGGGLHASGRKVVRGDVHPIPHEETTMGGKFAITKKKAAIGSAVLLLAVVTAFAMKKPAAAPSAATADHTAVVASGSNTSASNGAQNGQKTNDPAALAAVPMAPPPGALASSGGPPSADGAMATTDKDAASKHGKNHKVTPFGNGAVAHGNILSLKMDGPIDKIQGATQPTGFTVQLPNRKSVEPAGPLASKDSRIASVKVTNDPNGAELSFAFKDGIPNYQVRARGETLEIALAPVGKGTDKKIAKNGAHSKKGSKKKDKPKSGEEH